MVCFDLGGVMVRLCRSWEEGCRAAGLDARDPAMREQTRDVRKRLVTEYQRGRIDTQTFAHSISETLNGLYSPDEILAVHRAWLRGEYPGIHKLIDDIHDAGLRTAALSNTNEAHWALMDDYPAVLQLHTHLLSHELGLHKPESAIYRAAEHHLNAHPHEIAYFDDLPENVDAARERGWAAHRIDPLGDTAAQVRDALISLDLPIATSNAAPSDAGASATEATDLPPERAP